MKASDVKELIIRSLDADSDPGEISAKLELEGVNYDFAEGFTDAVTNRLFAIRTALGREIDFVSKMNFAFRSIAISGIAAIILLMISIFMMEGSLSLNSFLGLKDNYDESIICLLMGK